MQKLHINTVQLFSSLPANDWQGVCNFGYKNITDHIRPGLKDVDLE
jgi:hypothetical protein